MPSNPHAKTSWERQRLIGQLRRSNNERAAAVAAHLEACEPTTPCRSAACPLCGVAFQATAVALVEDFIRTPARAIRNRMTAINVVPASGCVETDDLAVETGSSRCGTMSETRPRAVKPWPRARSPPAKKRKALSKN